MNKLLKYFVILIVAVGVCCSAVMAADLTEQDFGGNFKASVPSGADFADHKENSTTIYVDSADSLFIIFGEINDLNDDNVDLFYQGFTKDGTFKKTGTDGDLTLFDINDDNIGKYGAGINGDGKVVIVCGDDLDLVKEIANSVKFD